MRRERRLRKESGADNESEAGHPRRPWKTEKIDDGAEGADKTVVEEEPPQETKVIKSPTYTILENIATLTQHHLTSPTPNLRKRLLELLVEVSPTLALDEDSYLPLVNAIWPVVIERLDDVEPFVVISACDAICSICSASGDFLSSRIKTAWWSGLGKWCRTTKANALQNARPAKTVISITSSHKNSGPHSIESTESTQVVLPGRYTTASDEKLRSEVVSSTRPGISYGNRGKFGQAAQLWEAATRLLVTIVSYVRIDDALFDEILDLLADDLVHNKEVRQALEVINADGVWLCLYERGEVEPIPTPVLSGVEFPDMRKS
jgi:hypothetical protein